MLTNKEKAEAIVDFLIRKRELCGEAGYCEYCPRNYFCNETEMDIYEYGLSDRGRNRAIQQVTELLERGE